MNTAINKNKWQQLRGLLLSEAGLSITDIGRQFKTTRQHAHAVLHGRHENDRAKNMREYAAEKAGKDPAYFWPDLYSLSPDNLHCQAGRETKSTFN